VEHSRWCNSPQDGKRYADCFACTLDGGKFRWRSPMFMPRILSRITLEVTEVRVQRLQQIDGRDVLAEGVDNGKSNPTQGARWENMQRMAFEERWNSINGRRRRREEVHLGDPGYMVDRPWRTVVDESASWASNPWVWAITFRRTYV
jgi:hypothetical protein